MAAAIAADSLNPRVDWVRGGMLWNLPPAAGGDRSLAVSLYERGARAAPATDAIAPDWGRPENLMALSWTLVNGQKPDARRAEQYALEALRLVPEWYYVADVLLPQIRAASAKRGG
jgi:hypothetical protein